MPRSPLRVDDRELAPVLVERRRRRRRQRLRELGVAECEVVVLDRDDVREVGLSLDRHVDLEPLRALVAKRDPLLQPGSHEALARDRDRVARKSRRGAVAEVERRPEVLHPSPRRGEAARCRRREARGARETACRARRSRSSARRCRRGRPRCRTSILRGSSASISSSRRTIRAPLDCWSALITISSTFTCNGRVSANRMQSATSSGVMGSTPSYTAAACSASPLKRTSENSVPATSPASTVVIRIGRPRRSSRRP